MTLLHLYSSDDSYARAQEQFRQQQKGREQKSDFMKSVIIDADYVDVSATGDVKYLEHTTESDIGAGDVLNYADSPYQRQAYSN